MSYMYQYKTLIDFDDGFIASVVPSYVCETF